ncbi:MAG: hypothetical protein NT098_01105 [Candidatus Parcubacteria bacterium]|nr:hypothetical protein [Candidatus Parcubacteria bacterium]
MQKGNGILGIIIVIAIIWGISSLFQNEHESDSITQESPNYEAYQESKDCSDLEPESPYDDGSGHYAGFEWGQNGNDCGGNSNSFIEGCEDYQAQEEAYETCLSN